MFHGPTHVSHGVVGARVLARFQERTGLPPSAIDAPLREAEARGLIERDWQRVRPTARGFDFLSDLQSLFLG